MRALECQLENEWRGKRRKTKKNGEKVGLNGENERKKKEKKKKTKKKGKKKNRGKKADVREFMQGPLRQTKCQLGGGGEGISEGQQLGG